MKTSQKKRKYFRKPETFVLVARADDFSLAVEYKHIMERNGIATHVSQESNAHDSIYILKVKENQYDSAYRLLEAYNGGLEN